MSATAVCPEPLELRSELSLAQLLARAHEDIHADGVADCPACGGALRANELLASCEDCGARLF